MAKANATSFKSGRRKTGGRRIGVPNRNTRVLREAVLLAAAAAGSENGENGLFLYLTKVAKKQPAIFLPLLGRLLPLQVESLANLENRSHVPQRCGDPPGVNPARRACGSYFFDPTSFSKEAETKRLPFGPHTNDEGELMHLQNLKISAEDFQLIHEFCRARARESFVAFRSWIRPDLIIGWWLCELAQHLQAFYEDFMAGKRPRLAILAPPQHGKTTIVNDLCAYVAGRNPDKKIIYASYGDDLGLRANSEMQRTILSPSFQEIFPGTRIGMPGWQCTQSLVEFVEQTGSFRNTTVNGAVTGFQLHLGIIDDPLKGRREAESKLIRNRNWSWLTDDFMT